MTDRSSGELKRLARIFLAGNYAIPILAMLIAAFLPAMVLTPFSIGISLNIDLTTVTYLAATFIIKVLGQLLIVNVTRIHLLLAKQQQVTFVDLIWAFRNHPDRFILGTLLLYSIKLVPAIPAAICMLYLLRTGSLFSYILLGLMAVFLCILELYITYIFYFIYLLYIDHPEMSLSEIFSSSRHLMRGNIMRIFLLQLSFIGWRFLGICSCGIGFLWIDPYISQTSVNFYMDVTGQLMEPQEHIDIIVTD